MTSAQGRSIIYSLAAIAVLGSLATQLIVPALPVMAHEFDAGTAATQRVISLYLIGLAVGQLVCGPMADRIGRRPVMLGGLALFILGSAAAALAPSLPLLLAARFVQALGGAAGIITARVMVGDIFPAEETATRQATMMSVVLLSPTIAPVIGGALTEWMGWRSAFGLLAFAGFAAAAFALLRIKESRTPAAPAANNLLHAYAILARNPRFTGNALAIAGGSAALYMFLAATPFLLAHDHGLGPRDTGLCLLLVAATSIVGTKFVGRFDKDGSGLLIGTLLSVAGTVLLAITAFAGVKSLAAFLLPISLMGFGTGILGPSGFAQIVRAQPGLEGTAASLAGAVQMLASALTSGLIGQVSALKLALAMMVPMGVALIAALLARYGVKEQVGQ